jgi:hypothetical protein
VAARLFEKLPKRKHSDLFPRQVQVVAKHPKEFRNLGFQFLIEVCRKTYCFNQIGRLSTLHATDTFYLGGLIDFTGLPKSASAVRRAGAKAIPLK